MQQLIRKLKFWKYFLLIFVSIISLIIAVTHDNNPITTLSSNLSASAITGLVLSLIYDLFVTKENKLSNDIDREEMGRNISLKLLGGYGPEIMPEEQLLEFFNKTVSTDKALYTLARAAMDTDTRAETLSTTVLQPLFRDPLLVEMEVRNNLLPDENDEDRYFWELEQKFDLDCFKSTFRCIVTADNDIGSELNSSREDCDSLVLLSPKTTASIQDLLNTASLSMTAEKIVDGRRSISSISPIVVIDQILTIYPEWPKEWIGLVAVVDFPLQDEGISSRYTLSFHASNRISDGFFYWIADRPCHLRSIEIDYSRIRSKLGRVAVIPTIAGRSVRLFVDRERGRVTTQADCVVWPGQGIFCVWRPHFKNKSASIGKSIDFTTTEPRTKA